MTGHLNWRCLADRRTDAHIVMLYKISHELVAIPKTGRLIYHQLDSHRTCSLSLSLSYQTYTTHTLTTQTAIFLSFFKQYRKLWQSPPKHCEEWLLSHSNQLFQSLTINSLLLHVKSFFLTCLTIYSLFNNACYNLSSKSKLLWCYPVKPSLIIQGIINV